MSAVKLHGYWRSSATYRVRIALNLKGIAYETIPVHLIKDGGEQHAPAFREKNPMEQVPVLEVEHAGAKVLLTQSVAIVEYLDETHPEPPLLPRDPVARARVRAAVEAVNSGIQPLHNLPVLGELKRLGGDEVAWSRGVIERGLAALEKLHDLAGGRYLVGDTLTLADVFLVPQLYGARRFKADLASCPKLHALSRRLEAMDAFHEARPEAQPDYVPPPTA
jgi:maleylpyruvate isomerase